jgi:hypothetical protein
MFEFHPTADQNFNLHIHVFYYFLLTYGVPIYLNKLYIHASKTKGENHLEQG